MTLYASFKYQLKKLFITNWQSMLFLSTSQNIYQSLKSIVFCEYKIQKNDSIASF